jgi:Fe2+ transport system protein FeoA
MTLTDCRSGDQVKIIRVNAGRGAVRNLSRLGLRVGNVVAVIRNSLLRGPVVVNYRETEIAVGHKLASRILVDRQ